MVALIIAALLATGPHIPVKLRRESGAAGHSVPAPLPLGTSTPLCQAIGAGDKTGNWWCLNGDGTMAAGSAITLSPVNAPQVLSWDVCGGVNCVAEMMTRLNPTTSSTHEGYESIAVAAPIGAVSICWLGRIENPTSTNGVGTEDILGHDLGAPFKLAIQGSAANTPPTNGVQLYMNGTTAYSQVTTVERITVLHCGWLNPGVSISACTYTQGVGATCNSTATVETQISQSSLKWQMGNAGNVMTGFFRGAFMTEKVLTISDVNRIGALVLPSNPTAMAFSRASPKTCGMTSLTRDVLLPNDMACVNNDIAEKEAVAIETFSPTETTGLGNFGSGGTSAAPIRVGEAGFSPYGMRSADMITFGDSIGASNYSRFDRSCGTLVAGDVVTFSYQVMGVSTSGTVDIGGNSGSGLTNDYQYNPCTFTSSAYATCSLTLTLNNPLNTGITLQAGNAQPNSGHPVQAVYITNFNCTKQSPARGSYIGLPFQTAPQTRAVEVCAGTNCPP